MKRLSALTVILLATFFPVSNIFGQFTKLAGNTLINSAIDLNGKFIMIDEVGRLWTTDGTPAGTKIFTSKAMFNNTLNGLILLNSKVFFAGVDAANGTELWVTDGTDAGTTLVKDINPGAASSFTRNFTIFNGNIYFSANDGVHGVELWKSDGTAAGTVMVKDIYPGLSNGISTDIHLYANDSKLFFSANDGVHGVELWASDGTTTNTKLIRDLTPGNESTEFNILTFLNTSLLIAVTIRDPEVSLSTNQLWRTDGTETDTKLIKNFGKALQSGFGENFHFKNKVYFVPPTAANGYELWVTDGTTIGTTLVKDIDPGTEGSSISLADAVSYSDKFIFKAYSGSGSELWSSDGTASGTQLFADIFKGAGSSNPVTLTNDATVGTNRSLYNGMVLFTADDGIHGDELWATDGTTANTKILKDIYPGPIRSTNDWTYSCFFTSQKMYFTAVDEEHGYELWETDGKTTVMIADIAPGYVGSLPVIIGVFNKHLYFVADDGITPRNLYILDELTSTLPVNLADFTAIAMKKDVQVNWATVTEINTSNFIIQRSTDGRQFENEGTVQAAGNSSTTRQYSFVDLNALHTTSPILYYRLQTNDKDGKQYYSPIVPVKISGGTPGMAVYPNPATDLIQLNFNMQGSKEATLRVTDASGKVVLSRSLTNLQSNNQTSLSVQTLPSGVYYVQLVTDKGTQSAKFIKQP